MAFFCLKSSQIFRQIVRMAILSKNTKQKFYNRGIRALISPFDEFRSIDMGTNLREYTLTASRGF